MYSTDLLNKEGRVLGQGGEKMLILGILHKVLWFSTFFLFPIQMEQYSLTVKTDFGPGWLKQTCSLE